MKNPKSPVALPAVSLDGRLMTPVLTAYARGDGFAIQIYSDEGPFMRLSVNLSNEMPPAWSFWAKTWSENEPYTQAILDQCSWLTKSSTTRINEFGCCAELWGIQCDKLPDRVQEEIMALTGWARQDSEKTHAPRQRQ
jgi:hypothetical protein